MIRSKRYTAAALLIGSVVCAIDAASKVLVVADLAAYQHLYDNELIALPGVQRMASTLVMKRVVHDRPLPA